MEILMPVLIFGLIGLIMAIVLVVASKVFYVEVDPKEEKILSLLPGANCGGCGFAGCSACAAAVASGDAPCGACPGVSNEVLAKICEIMGVEATEREPKKAYILCSGSMDKANYKYYFDGSKSCEGVDALRGGDKMCSFACLGYGDCVDACNFNALSIENGLAKVNEENCVGCGACTSVCPRGIISVMPVGRKTYVKCKSLDNGKVVNASCSAGCIGCKICEKNCEQDAIKVIDNIAKIDYEKCNGCGICAEKCPKKVIEVKKIDKENISTPSCNFNTAV